MMFRFLLVVLVPPYNSFADLNSLIKYVVTGPFLHICLILYTIEHENST